MGDRDEAGAALGWRLRAELATLALEAGTAEAFASRATARLQALVDAAQVVFWRLAPDGSTYEATHPAPNTPVMPIPRAVFSEVASQRGFRHVAIATGSGTVRTCLLGPVVAGPSLVGMLQVVPREPSLVAALQHTLEGVPGLFAAGLHHAERLDALRWQAGHDALTGLPNRRAWQAMMDRETRLAVRHGLPLSVLVLDIDHFKRFNDAHGHAAGDALLKAVARGIASCGRTTDCVARWGGEEFVVLLPHTDGPGAAAAATKVLEALRKLGKTPEGFGESISGSVGVATWPDDCADAADLVSTADRAMYRAKRAGRDRVARGGEGLARP